MYLALTLASLAPLALPAAPFASPPVQAEALEQARGGFALPGGLEVNIAVLTETLVNGQLRLRTEFAVDRTRASLMVTGPGGTAASQVGGLTVTQDGSGAVVSLIQPDFTVTHLIGQAYGALVINRANDVAVQTAAEVNLVLDHATGFNLGSAGLRVQDLALDSAARLAR